MRTAGIAGSLLAAALSLPGDALASGGTATGHGALQAKAAIDIRVVVPPVMRLRTVASRATIEVGADEAARGLATVAGAAILDIVCNRRAFALRLDIVDPAVAAVEVEGLGHPVRALPGGTTVYIPVRAAAERRQQRTLDYRVHYAPGTTAGRRPMPVAISLGGA